jgi:hypothetical protein
VNASGEAGGWRVCFLSRRRAQDTRLFRDENSVCFAVGLRDSVQPAEAEVKRDREDGQTYVVRRVEFDW